jgi:2-phospho-L-lactate guanylyltransferase
VRAEDLSCALQAVDEALATHRAAPMAVVPDAEETGSVLLAARSADAIDPAFGPGSAAEHLRRGAVRLGLSLPRLRRDVDTPSDLLAVLELGAGPHTARVAAAHLASRHPARLLPRPAPGSGLAGGSTH